jgi:proteasome alpha subunit
MGVRIADLRGYSYDRRDVTARGLANAYAQTLGTIFSSAGEKPFEVELVVAEVGDGPADDQIYRLTYDGSVADEHGWMVMGGQTEPIATHLEQNYKVDLPVEDALRLAVRALGEGNPGPDGPRRILANQLEVAVLDRTRPKRKFRRLNRPRLEEILGAVPADTPPPSPAEDTPPHTDAEPARPPVGPEPPKPGATDTGSGDGPAL